MDPAFERSQMEADQSQHDPEWKDNSPFDHDPLLCSAPENYAPLFDDKPPEEPWTMPGAFQPETDAMHLDSGGGYFVAPESVEYSGTYESSPYGPSFLLNGSQSQLSHFEPKPDTDPHYASYPGGVAYPEEQNPGAFYVMPGAPNGSGYYPKSLFADQNQQPHQNQSPKRNQIQSQNQTRDPVQNENQTFQDQNQNPTQFAVQNLPQSYQPQNQYPEENTFSIPSSDNNSPNEAPRSQTHAVAGHHFAATPTYSSPRSGPDSVHALANPEDNHSSGLGVPADIRDSVSHRTSISAGVNELSPLTTSTSFTPSISSIHSTQPSFFSAQQFLRPSMDQPPSSIHRGSIDVYSRHRLSIDSSNSGANAPQRQQKSFTSYFSFMDRDRKQQLSQGDSPISNGWSPPAVSQPRNSIRRIFKTGHQQPEDDDSGMDPSALNASFAPFSEDMMEADSVQKHAKRSKRGLFNRLKVRVNSAGPAEAEMDSPFLYKEGDTEEDLKTSDHSLAASQKSDHGSSTKGITNGLKHLNSGSSASGDGSLEPDYGALFSGVGKRRNLVGMKKKKAEQVKKEAEAFIKKEYDVSVKLESGGGVRTEADSLEENRSHTFGDTSGDCLSASSVCNSQISAVSKDSGELQGGSAFANASKRILGARLLKKKNRSETPSSDVVEIDLQSLDLPQDTQIIPKANTTSRTRGRKEDKAADLEDQSKIFVCGYCSRRFKRQEHLKRHFRSLHTLQKPYDCPFCPKKFSRTDNLNQHLKVHKQEEDERRAAEGS